jgi:dTDP-4-dehydrorhamnose reductase
VQPILITGATGTLGRAFARVCGARRIPFQATRRGDLDIADRASVEEALERIQPWAVINTAGYVRVDDAEADEPSCLRENAEGPAILAEACAARSIDFVTFSSDLVFDGEKGALYEETDPVRPLNAYGRAKALAEARVGAAFSRALIIRTSAFFGPWDEHNFVTVSLRRLKAGETVKAAGDAVVSPTYVPDLVSTTLDLLIDGESGVWHLASAGALTWSAFAREAAELAGLNASAVEPEPTARLGLAARRPLWSALGSARAALMPSLNDALGRYFGDRAAYLREIEAPVLICGEEGGRT